MGSHAHWTYAGMARRYGALTEDREPSEDTVEAKHILSRLLYDGKLTVAEVRELRQQFFTINDRLTNQA